MQKLKINISDELGSKTNPYFERSVTDCFERCRSAMRPIYCLVSAPGRKTARLRKHYPSGEVSHYGVVKLEVRGAD